MRRSNMSGRFILKTRRYVLLTGSSIHRLGLEERPPAHEWAVR